MNASRILGSPKDPLRVTVDSNEPTGEEVAPEAKQEEKAESKQEAATGGEWV